MKKIIAIIILVSLQVSAAKAQNYSVSLIPDSLKENADAIIRLDERVVTIKSLHKLVIKRKKVVTILNQNGEAFAYYSGYYDKFRSISDISGTLYDALGIKVKSVKKKDITDVSISDGFSLMTDARAKRFAFYSKDYPYTVEFEDEVEYDGTYSIPDWVPVPMRKAAVQKSVYSIQIPENYQLNYRQFNYNSSPIINVEREHKTYTWQLENYKAIEFESFLPEWRDITPSVFLTPTEFEYAGYKGTMATWKEFGLFSKQLNEGRDILPEKVKADVHQLTDKLSSPVEKVNILYDYLQKNTRYISIQLGIGGLQPFEAKFVAEKRYGDCKALSNYMVSLLKEAGIKAYYTLVAAGENESKSVIENFPGDYFNHIITCVPLAKDTLWLECTSQTVSAGYMGTFTGNRKALMIGDDGGYLVSTPKYSSKENLQNRKVDAVVNAEGMLVANVKTVFTGLQQELPFALKNELNNEYRKKYLNNYINLPTYEVERNEYIEIKGRIPIMEEYLKIVAPNFGNTNGKRLFVAPNLFNRNGKLSNDKPRRFNIEYENAFTDVDTIIIKVPDGYTIEAMPKNIELKNKFGIYKIKFSFSNNAIEMIRYYERNMGTYPKTDYEELVKFYDDMYKADRSKVVLVRKE